MKMHLKRIIKDRAAFTIVESIISLLVAAMVLLLCSLVINYAFDRRQHENNLTAFHLYLKMLESDQYRFKYVNHQHQRLILAADNKKYIVRLARGSVKMTTERGGYIPLLDGVASVNWQYHDSILKTKLIMQNGYIFTAKSLMKSR